MEEEEDEDVLMYGTNTDGVAEPITLEALYALYEKLASQHPASYYEIISPDEWKRRVRKRLRDAGRQN